MLNELLKYHNPKHSQFQQDNFITSKHGYTTYGMFKQSLRELFSRVSGLREDIYSIEKTKIELDKNKHLSNHTNNPFEKRQSKLDYKFGLMRLKDKKKKLADNKKEFIRFYQQAIYLKEKLGDLDQAKIDKLDAQMWEHKVKEMAVLDFSTTKALSKKTVEFLQSFPKELKTKIFQDISHPNKLLLWYTNLEDIIIPDKLPKIEYNFDKLLIEE